jgi:hypothetical protein
LDISLSIGALFGKSNTHTHTHTPHHTKHLTLCISRCWYICFCYCGGYHLYQNSIYINCSTISTRCYLLPHSCVLDIFNIMETECVPC